MNIKNKIVFTGLLSLLSAIVLLVGCAENETRGDSDVVKAQVVEAEVLDAPFEVIRGEGTGVFTDISVSSASMFDFDKAELNEEGKDVIEIYKKTVGPALMEAYLVLIVGHTDTSGDANYNKTLSLKRANSVANYLISTGMEEDKIRVIGRGSEEPVASNKTHFWRLVF